LPSNDFGGQEPGAAKEINATAHGEYHVTFRFTEKLAVKGKDAHPFYRWAAEERPLDAVTATVARRTRFAATFHKLMN